MILNNYNNMAENWEDDEENNNLIIKEEYSIDFIFGQLTQLFLFLKWYGCIR